MKACRCVYILGGGFQDTSIPADLLGHSDSTAGVLTCAKRADNKLAQQARGLDVLVGGWQHTVRPAQGGSIPGDAAVVLVSMSVSVLVLAFVSALF